MPPTELESRPKLGEVTIGEELRLIGHSVGFRSLAAVCEQMAADLEAADATPPA